MNVTVDVDPRLFDMQGDLDYRHMAGDGEASGGWEIEPYFLVRSADLDVAADALEAAGRRFMHVTEHGDEVADPAGAYQTGAYTPNVVVGPRVLGQDVFVRVNTKGYLWAPMAHTMVRILVEELERRDATAVVTGVEGFPQGEPRA